MKRKTDQVLPGAREEKEGLTTKGCGETLGGNKNVLHFKYTRLVLVAMLVYTSITSIKTHQIIHFKEMQFIIGKVCFSKVDVPKKINKK